MRKRERVRYEMFIRVVTFIQNNIADFPAGGIVAGQLAVLLAVIERIESLSGEQAEGLAGAKFEFFGKDTARENLTAIMRKIARTARSMVYEFPGIVLKFRIPENDSDVNMLATGRAFHSEATPLKNDFIRYEMQSGFLDELQTEIDNFDAALSKPGTEIDSHVEATADIGEEIRKGMIAVRTVNAPIKNKYAGDVGKLAAWLSASHIEREPKNDPQPQP